MIGLLRERGSQLSVVVVLLIMLALTDLVPPYAIKLLIDDVFTGTGQAEAIGGAWRLLGLILFGLFLSYIARNALFYASKMLSLRMSEDICFSMRRRLFDHLQQMSLRFYRSNQPGRVSARVMDDTYKIQTFIQEKLPLLMLNLIKFQILICVICVTNIRLALAAIIILPLQFITYRFFKGPIKLSHSEAQENLSLAYGSVVEKFLGVEVVKGFNAEARESETFNAAINESRKSQIKSQRYHFAQKVTADLLVGLGTILLLAYGAFEVIKGHMKSGEFMMFFGYVMMLYPSVLEIISGVGHSSKATASVSRVMDMLEVPIHDEGVMHRESGDTSDLLRADIVFDSVGFAFDDATEVLHNISFSIPHGSRIAITGPSGSGKSTTINLLPRFLKPSSGSIKIGERDTADLPLTTLRSGISIAFQEVFLFNATIDENLRYARPDATRAEVERACKITGVHDMISRLPKGYETRLSDFGVELSRGEKQRITLARALMKNSPILILDEATASIDRESSRALVQTIFEEVQNRTIIMVTHEANLLDLVDRVICIRDGKVDYDGEPEAYVRREYGITPMSIFGDTYKQRSTPGEDQDQSSQEPQNADNIREATPMGYIEPSEHRTQNPNHGRFDTQDRPDELESSKNPPDEGDTT